MPERLKMIFATTGLKAVAEWECAVYIRRENSAVKL
jgi:hypothetical protein